MPLLRVGGQVDDMFWVHRSARANLSINYRRTNLFNSLGTYAGRGVIFGRALLGLVLGRFLARRGSDGLERFKFNSLLLRCPGKLARSCLLFLVRWREVARLGLAMWVGACMCEKVSARRILSGGAQLRFGWRYTTETRSHIDSPVAMRPRSYISSSPSRPHFPLAHHTVRLS